MEKTTFIISTPRNGLAILALALLLSFAVSAQTTTDGNSSLVAVFITSNVDTDGDGLTDEVEAQLGSDAELSDSDGDGMADGWEIWNALDPSDPADAAADDDGDGVTNVEEQDLGSMPAEADTDGDGFWDGVEFAAGSSVVSSDSHPVSSVFGDLNCDGSVNALDIQTVINGALGKETPVPANANGVGSVNALDVQAVIVAALGL
jgi:dockerin type I repeat protein/thrombospondin type 3 repeat protein